MFLVCLGPCLEQLQEGAKLHDGDSIFAVAQQPKVATTWRAFALWCVGGDRIVSWGDPAGGGDSTAVCGLKNVQEIVAGGWFGCHFLFSHILGMSSSQLTFIFFRGVQTTNQVGTSSAFAAIVADGRVVTWGNPRSGGDSTAVRDQLRNVQQIRAGEDAFAALLADGTVVTWGRAESGGDSSAVRHQLRNVQQIHATNLAFAAILADGTVVTWGDQHSGGDSTAVQDQLRNVRRIYAAGYAFAALLADKTVVTWGDPTDGGNSTGVQDRLRDVAEIHEAMYAFAAILADGSVVTWGDPELGGDCSSVQEELRHGAKQIHGTWCTFFATLEGRSVTSGYGSVHCSGHRVISWGKAEDGCVSSAVQAQLGDVQQILATNGAFAALLAGGTVA